MKKGIRAGDLNLGNRFLYDGKLWQHCGWYSAVYHVCGFCLRTGEQRVISCHEFIEPFIETYLNGLGI